MIRLGNRTILLGGFHEHWARADMENPTLLLAALNYYHYDFVTLQDEPELAAEIHETTRLYSDGLRIYPGREVCYAWGHIITVAPRGGPPPSDEPDPTQILAQLRKTCDLVVLAHPSYPTTWTQLYRTGRMDRLMDDGLIDAVNLINAAGFDGEHHRELMGWYRQREAAGKHTPVVGGWDVHIVMPARNLPVALYSAQRPPSVHFDSPLGNRTIVFAEENALPAICAAVKEGKTVIEDLDSGELIGPTSLVEFLEENGYREAITKMDARRDAVTVSVPSPWTAGSPVSLRVSENGVLRIAGTLRQATARKAAGGESVGVRRVPALLQRDRFYSPLAWRGSAGGERIWGIETEHPIRFEVLPWLGQGGSAVELLPKTLFCGTVSLEVEGFIPRLQRELNTRTLIRVDSDKLSNMPVHYRFEAWNRVGIRRSLTGFLTFVGVPRFRGDWSGISRIGVDKPQFTARGLFGANRPWPGPAEFSAQLQFAWTETEFLMRAEVRDPIHCQPFAGHFAYNGDCLQLAVDPMLRRCDTIGNVYSFNLALTAQGPEVYRFLYPAEEASERFTPPPGDVFLDGCYLQIDPVDGGLVYLLKLPWAELAPRVPAPGIRMGIYYIMFNNNGHGHLDTLHWPVPIQGMWMVPSRWGVIELLGD